MPNKKTKQQKPPLRVLAEQDPNTPKTKSCSFFQLVPKKEPSLLLPVVTGPKGQFFEQSTRKLTSSNYTMPTVTTTPAGKHLSPDENGVCGLTSSGSKLIYSPSRHLEISVTPNDDGKTESIDLYLLVRERDYKPTQTSPVYDALANLSLSEEKTLSATASNETYSEQQPRKKARHEASVVGKSAETLIANCMKKSDSTLPSNESDNKKIITAFLKNCGFKDAVIQEYVDQKWNLCHMLSYGIAMNSKASSGKAFNTQIFENLFSGTREFNENMMRIENVLLQLIKNKAVREIEYMSFHAEFEGTHVIAKLTLKANLQCHDGTVISFEYPIDVSDKRKLSHEASTAYYAAIQSLINHSSISDAENSPSKKLGF